MSEYKKENFEMVHNPSYVFYTLYINGKCYFKEFFEHVCSISSDKKNIISILSMMDMYGQVQFPEKKFRIIRTTLKRSDIFEFKKDNLRVYVIINKPNIYIVMGGYKDSQKKDIRILQQRLKDFNEKLIKS